MSQNTEKSAERLQKSESIFEEGLQNQTIHGISHKVYIYEKTIAEIVCVVGKFIGLLISE